MPAHEENDSQACRKASSCQRCRIQYHCTIDLLVAAKKPLEKRDEEANGNMACFFVRNSLPFFLGNDWVARERRIDKKDGNVRLRVSRAE
jgi:hypothetical protein